MRAEETATKLGLHTTGGLIIALTVMAAEDAVAILWTDSGRDWGRTAEGRLAMVEAWLDTSPTV